ncbi:ribosomal protein 63, mitochondrial-like [Plakobranchus ocellatus]|uniref:Ribosomal protein 63, mitochondrial-like n=1 Tax=Plakobranchus ocellatus TaxID=259542 RepID=A0AAV4C5M4_9GAST|nr:ribosomal protein 63, mitochondrial-like [Plakobranchus ocellatus]
MRLSQGLQFYIRYRRVPGLLRYGKHRVIPPISIDVKRKVAELMLIEKENVDILNKPYLSVINMRLSQGLQFYIRYRRVPGLLRYGKHRVIPPISIDVKRKVAELMLIERENVDILNKPYLSVAQEESYDAVVEREPYQFINKTKYAIELEKLQEKLESFRPHYTTDDLLSHLNTTKSWE